MALKIEIKAKPDPGRVLVDEAKTDRALVRLHGECVSFVLMIAYRLAQADS